MLHIEGLSKTYAKGSVKAVDNISLHVKPGEIFGFLGPNGAGKTTTIKMMVGILTPDSGAITIHGKNIVSDAIEAKRQIGYVPDTHEVYDRLSGYEYLNFVADMYQVSTEKRKERMEKYLHLFEIEKAASSQVKSYSHGMRQKLMLTAALLHEPPLWLLDEPMVGLDPLSAHRLKEEMRLHCDAGNTVFFSTHVLDVAERLCDRVGIIRGGKLIAIGTLDELRRGSGGESLESIFLELTEGGEVE